MTLRGLISSNKQRAIFIILLYFIFAVTGSLDQYFFQFAVNGLSVGNLPVYIRWQLIEFIPVVCGVFILPLATYLFNAQIQEYLDQLRGQMVDHFYTENDATVAQMQNYLQSNLDTLTSDFALPWVNVLSNLFIILLSAGVLFSLNWSFVLLTAIFVLIDLSLPKIMARMTSEASRKVMKNTSAFLTGIGEWINGLNELRRYHAWTILNKELSSYAEKLEKSKINQTNKNCASNTINGIGNTLGQMSIAFLAGILFLTGQIKIGAALASTSFAFGIFSAVSSITSAAVKIKSTKNINQTTASLISNTKSRQKGSSAQIAQIEIKNLALKYPNGPIIKYPDFVINKGEKVLLSGDSGTGKSTLLQALLGKIKPYQGQIIFRNNTGQIFQPNLNRISYIAQDPQLFPGTIAENIVMFHQQLLDQVPNLINKVQLQSDIARFPQGTDTQVDLDKNNLSGGQRQKIILARSEVFADEIILLDEATSAIDSKATKQIIAELVHTNKTVIMIAHNLNSEVKNMFDKTIRLASQKENHHDF